MFAYMCVCLSEGFSEKSVPSILQEREKTLVKHKF